jgi:hypothetical protein
LNENAGAIQAVATVVLVGITGWYAWLTHRLVNVQEAARRERMAELRSVVITLRNGLEQLPIEKATAIRVMRNAALWDEGDLPALRTQASWFSSDAGDHAASALAPLRWLGAKTRESKDAGFNWERFPWDDYNHQRTLAERHLLAIWRAITE